MIRRFIDRIKGWFAGLNDQWRAALRTAWQTVVGAVLAFLIGVIGIATNVVNGGTLEDAIADTSNLGKIAVLAFLSALSGLVAFAMNRSGARKQAHYSTPEA